MERDSARFGGWTPTKDIHGLVADGITHPTGIWSDNTTMWVVDYRDFKLYAYTLATGARNEDKEFDLDPANDAPPWPLVGRNNYLGREPLDGKPEAVRLHAGGRHPPHGH